MRRVKGQALRRVNASRLARTIIDHTPHFVRRSALLFWLDFVYPSGLQRPLDQLAQRSTVHLGDLKFVPNDFHSLYSILAPNFEEWVWQHLAPSEDQTFIDVGAHIGRYSIQVARLVGPKGLVISIEPDPVNYSFLTKNIRLNSATNIIPLRIAAWDSDTRLRLTRATGSGESSVAERALKGIDVPGKRLDLVLPHITKNPVDWIKIDVEGTAEHVIRGLRETLLQDRPRVIVEVHKGTGESQAVPDLMERTSYTLKAVERTDPSSRTTHMFFESK